MALKTTSKKVKTTLFVYKIFDYIVKITGFTLILMGTSIVFENTLYIDNTNYGLWGFLAAILVYLLNKTIKPFLVWLTIPITGLTMGLFYPFINLIILKIVSLILAGHFEIYGIWFALIASVLISVMNIIVDDIIDKGKAEIYGSSD